MTVSNVFMHVGRGNILSKNLGLTGVLNTDYTYAKDYSHLNLKLGKASKLKGKAGDFVVLKPVVTISPKKCKAMIVPNGILSTVGTVSYQSILEEGDEKLLGMSIKLEKDFDFSQLEFLCRLYLIYG